MNVKERPLGRSFRFAALMGGSSGRRDSRRRQVESKPKSMDLMSPVRRSLHGRLSREEGFTMIELVIAVGIILTALLLMAYTATVSFSDAALARQRQGANGLAVQAMEQIRGLPFDTIRKGLSNSDLSGDSNIVTCGTVKCYAPLNETIPTSNYAAGTTITPLVPH